MNTAFYGNPDAQENAFYIGVTRIEDGALGAIGNNIDLYLLGVPYPNPSYKFILAHLILLKLLGIERKLALLLVRSKHSTMKSLVVFDL
jgi:hypothetical protein